MQNYSLYIHLPWCLKKCPYCDFNSHTAKGTLPEKAYVARLKQDLEAEMQRFPGIKNRKLGSIFFGGGTPSLFSAESLDQILSDIRSQLVCSPSLEITLEANPGAVDQARFYGYRQAGINRLSIGVQSFQDAKLKALGRIHQADKALKAVQLAREAGFENLNIDLMYGLPEQTDQEALDDLSQAIALVPAHISWYELTIEPNTLFYRHRPSLPDQDQRFQMQTLGQAILSAHGYRQYEVSAYAKHDQVCAHNLHYWQFGDYIGLGAGAHGKWTDNQGVFRRLKYKHPTQYLTSKSCLQSEKIVEVAQLPFEFMLNRLRLNRPLAFEEFEQRTGLPIQTIASQLTRAKTEGLITCSNTHLQLTTLGGRFLNTLIEIFL